jgi:hypothetical protein
MSCNSVPAEHWQKGPAYAKDMLAIGLANGPGRTGRIIWYTRGPAARVWQPSLDNGIRTGLANSISQSTPVAVHE